MTYDEAMERFGHDAPDLRFGMEIVDCTDLAAEAEFRVFHSVANSGGRVRAINAKRGTEQYSRRGIDALTEFVAEYGAKGLAWFRVEEDGTLNSTIAKNFTPELLQKIGTRLAAEPGDLLLFVADSLARHLQGVVCPPLENRPRDEALRTRPNALLVGRRISDVRTRRGRRPLERHAPSVHGTARSATWRCWIPIRGNAAPRPTTW